MNASDAAAQGGAFGLFHNHSYSCVDTDPCFQMSTGKQSPDNTHFIHTSSSSWSSLNDDVLKEIFTYLPFNDLMNCYTLEKRCCEIISSRILKPKVKQITCNPADEKAYSCQHYEKNIRPWLESLGQNGLVSLLDHSMGNKYFHKIFFFALSEIFNNAQQLKVEKKYEVHSDRSLESTFSPDGSNAIVTGIDATARVLTCHHNTDWTEIYQIDTQPKSMRSGHFSPDGHKVAAVSDNGTLYVLTLAHNEQDQQVVHNEEQVEYSNALNSVTFSPDGHNLLLMVADNTCRMLSLNHSTGHWVETTNLNLGAYLHQFCSFTPDGKKLVVSAYKGFLHFMTLGEPELNSPLLSLSFLKECLRRTLFSDPGPFYREHHWVKQPSDPDIQGLGTHLDFHPDGNSVLVGLPSEGPDRFNLTTCILRLDKGQWMKRQEFSKNLEYFSFQFSPDGQTLIAKTITDSDNTPRTLCIFTQDPSGDWVKSRRYSHYVPLLPDENGPSPFGDIKFSPDSETLLLPLRGGIAIIYSHIDGEWHKVCELEHDDHINRTLFSPDSRTLATSAPSGLFYIWYKDNKGWTIQQKIDAGAHAAFDFSPDGQRLAVISDTGKACILKLENKRWQMAINWFRACKEGSNSIKFSPTDGNIVVHQSNKRHDLLDRDFSSSFVLFNLTPVLN